jgi:alpha-mannosidase
MRKPTVHLICNAHLDPVWQWRWEEGCAEALATFGSAVQLLKSHPSFIFNHNEAVLYRWVLQHDPALFEEIRTLVRKGRWHISGGWYLQPDANMPGLESFVRHILLGRRFFRREFKVQPIVAYNFDSFGHNGGLPQILRRAGYQMYIHMRPVEQEMKLPSDLYRWRGIDGSEILTYRPLSGFYHSEYDNIEEKITQGVERALEINRDVPVFWGIGNHGGGATREDLRKIDALVAQEKRVEIIHSTPELLYEALKPSAKTSPVLEGDLQRAFTGCYTSLSRLKRRSLRSLGELVQAEALRAATWWNQHQPYPGAELDEAWHDHLFNDFHDILAGSCSEPAEQDALDQYGKVSESVRRIRLAAAATVNRGKHRTLYVPITVLNTNPSCQATPIEVEYMLDLRPKWTGTWHTRLYTLDGREILSQEEEPESVLPFSWRRRMSFFADLPPFEAGHFEVRALEGKKEQEEITPALVHRVDTAEGFINGLDAGGGRECLSGHLLKPLVLEDDGDSWGADRWSYRNLLGQFGLVKGSLTLLGKGPVRRITEAVYSWNKSRIALRTISYPNWPVMEFRARVQWNESRKRLKFSIPTVFKSDSILCEVPGGSIRRPADGQEHVQGRWSYLEGVIGGVPTGFGVVNSGQFGIDFQNGEIRLSCLRSAVYCHDQAYRIEEPPSHKYMDQGVHEVRLLLTAGEPESVRRSLPGLADWLSAPPLVYSHLPIGEARKVGVPRRARFLVIEPATIRLTALKRSEDGHSLVLRLHETQGKATNGKLALGEPPVRARLSFAPFELKTIRIDRTGKWHEVDLITEK